MRNIEPECLWYCTKCGFAVPDLDSELQYDSMSVFGVHETICDGNMRYEEIDNGWKPKTRCYLHWNPKQKFVLSYWVGKEIVCSILGIEDIHECKGHSELIVCIGSKGEIVHWILKEQLQNFENILVD